MTEEEVFTTVSEVLLGTDFAIRFAIQDEGLSIDETEAEEILKENGISQCPGCGFWSYIDDEYCVDCEDES